MKNEQSTFMRILRKAKPYLQSRLPWLFGTARAHLPQITTQKRDAGLCTKAGNTTRRLAASGEFALCVHEGGRNWYPYSIEFITPEGKFRVVMYALSDYHAAVLVDDLRNSAFSGGRIIERL